MPEHYFDLPTAGFVPGYAFSGGPGRVFFDEETKQFLRIEPLGGIQNVVQEEQAPAEPAPQEVPVSVSEPVTETQPAQEPAPDVMPEVTPIAETPIEQQSQMSTPTQEETPVQDSPTIDNGGTPQ